MNKLPLPLLYLWLILAFLGTSVGGYYFYSTYQEHNSLNNTLAQKQSTLDEIKNKISGLGSVVENTNYPDIQKRLSNIQKTVSTYEKGFAGTITYKQDPNNSQAAIETETDRISGGRTVQYQYRKYSVNITMENVTIDQVVRLHSVLENWGNLVEYKGSNEKHTLSYELRGSAT